MSNPLEERLARINQLVKEREAIDAELYDLLGLTKSDHGSTPRVIKAGGKKQKKERKKTACGICGQTGHTKARHKKEFVVAGPEQHNSVSKLIEEAQERSTGFSESIAEEAKPNGEVNDEFRMDRSDYIQVMQQKRNGLPANECVVVLNLKSLHEVKVAYESSSFMDYIKRRKES